LQRMRQNQALALSALALAPACNAFGFPGYPAPPPNAPPFLYEVSYPVTFIGTTGSTGPSLSSLQSTYGVWSLNSDYFAQGSFQGYQLWTVPQSGKFKITAKGAQGGSQTSSYGYGAAGAKVSATFDLTRGQKIEIIVGQGGGGGPSDPHGNEGGGGGGSFVLKYPRSTISESDILLIAGGGGGAPGYGTSCNNYANRVDGEGQAKTTTEARVCSGGVRTSATSPGYGGLTAGSYQGGAGGGFRTAGQNGGSHCSTHFGGSSVQSGLVGGRGSTCYTSDNKGGFGGGGGGGLGGPGGGGGYSGGSTYGNWASHSMYGGGGSSYSNGADTEMLQGGGDLRTSKGLYGANGEVKIELLL